MEIYERDEYLRGDIYYIRNLGYSADCKLDIWRPAIIISNDAANKFSPNVTVIPLTSQEKKPLPTHVCISCRVQSTALCESIQTVAKSRIGEYIKHCTNKEMHSLEEAIRSALSIEKPVEIIGKKDVNETAIETQLAVAIAVGNVYKKLFSQSLSRVTRILNKRSKEM